MVQGAEAQSVVFDFEDQDIDQEGLTSLEVTAEGITMALSRPGDLFGITDIVGGTFGERSLSPFFPGTTQNRPFIANFSVAVSSVSIDAGDFVSCVSHVTQVLEQDGYLTDIEAEAIRSCAVREPLP